MVGRLVMAICWGPGEMIQNQDLQSYFQLSYKANVRMVQDALKPVRHMLTTPNRAMQEHIIRIID